ncbi:MAG: TIGR03560 family F420-dependent LLM class oxidoreductase [Anaerolineales bacterium]|nr:TIGR03560 family F420-dependent LLM class oxidoreductase [Anaerolineales bacterium]
MLEVAIFLEGQNGLNWPRWQRMAEAVERLGFVGLYRSDHFTNANPPDKDSLEMWISLAWLASHTDRIEFGPLVSPISFRHPAFTARMAAAVDDLSGGRLVLGLGAGWQEREHTNYGFDLLEINDRFDRFEEGLEIVRLLLNSDDAADFDGQYFQLQEGILLPRPQRPGGPPILIGGNGRKRTLPMTALYAQEWNALMTTPQEFSSLNQHLDGLLVEQSRDPGEVKRSMMVGCIIGADDSQVEQRVAERTKGERSADDLRQRGVIVGTPSEIAAQLIQLEQAGVQRVMLQWIDLDDIEGLEIIAGQVLPELV